MFNSKNGKNLDLVYHRQRGFGSPLNPTISSFKSFTHTIPLSHFLPQNQVVLRSQVCEAYPVLGVPPGNIKKTSNGIDGFNAPKFIIRVCSDTLLGGASETGMQKHFAILRIMALEKSTIKNKLPLGSDYWHCKFCTLRLPYEFKITKFQPTQPTGMIFQWG